ncbi:MAG: hypothetical protein E7490_08690 [Ruminococcaceae bacterium]|nr:hypothetical protein [Oscillospiraceae bacterium]
MKKHKQTISAIVLGLVIVLFISLYSIAALLLTDCFSDFLYENSSLYKLISFLNVLIIAAIVVLPTVFVTIKFGINPFQTIISFVIIFILYKTIPFLPFYFVQVTENIIATTRCITLWQEAASIALFSGVLMFVTSLIVTNRLKKHN